MFISLREFSPDTNCNITEHSAPATAPEHFLPETKSPSAWSELEPGLQCDRRTQTKVIRNLKINFSSTVTSEVEQSLIYFLLEAREFGLNQQSSLSGENARDRSNYKI